MFLGKGVLKICSKFTVEHPYQNHICCIFSEYLFLRTSLNGCFWKWQSDAKCFNPIVTTRAWSTYKNLKQLWSICNEQRECDSNSYDNGGLGRCESEGSKAKVQERMIRFLQDREHKFHEAASRLQMKNSFKAHDFYAVDVFITIPAI